MQLLPGFGRDSADIVRKTDRLDASQAKVAYRRYGIQTIFAFAGGIESQLFNRVVNVQIDIKIRIAVSVSCFVRLKLQTAPVVMPVLLISFTRQ